MIIEKINQDIIVAMKNHDKLVLDTLRFVKGTAKTEAINTKKEMNDEMMISVLSKQIKMRQDSIEQFKKGQRLDLIEKNESEIAIIQKYLPESLSREELIKLIDEIFLEVKPTSKADLGKIMKLLVPKVKGRADMNDVNSIINEKLIQNQG